MAEPKRFYLLDGTRQELLHIARERGINPNDIRAIRSPKDIYGVQGGEIIFGHTGVTQDRGEVINYARTHNIELPF